jgi:hypothetical protein
MARVVRELVRPVEQVRSETDLQTDIQILEVIAKDASEIRNSSTADSRDRACRKTITKLLFAGHSYQRVREAIVHAQKLVAQSNTNPA